VGGSEKSLFLWSGGSEKNRLFTADVQNDAPSHMYALSPCMSPLINGLVADALGNTPVML